ncbi:MAG TPA: F0F1 ATP synthase subunit B [Kiloniellales bacterium]|nr:F0F1 ATP synthase subunit B [Kiloniellales bacterium]
MLSSPEFWVAVAFLIFIGLVGKPIARFVTGALDSRSGRIRNEISEAQALREEAQKLLADYKRKQRDALKEADEILEHARVEAERLHEQARKDLETALKRREQAAMEKIAQAESQALREVRDQAIDLALAATERLIADSLDEKKSQALVERSIRELPDKLH